MWIDLVVWWVGSGVLCFGKHVIWVSADLLDGLFCIGVWLCRLGMGLPFVCGWFDCDC